MKRINAVASAVPWFLLAYGLFLQLRVLATRFDQPLFGPYHFRETQTALSTLWMTRGGPLFVYETPVAGHPYTIPFEFPLYQWLSAAVSVVSGLGIVEASRVVSIAAFLGMLGVLYAIVRDLALPRLAFAVLAALLCLSPLYLYWTGTVLIESTALFLCLAWLWLYLRALYAVERRQRVIYALAGMAVGALAITVKVTTFLPFVWCAFAATLIVFIPELWHAARQSRLVGFVKARTVHAVSLLGAVLVPLVALVMWTSLADAAKAQNDIGAMLTSDAVSLFTLGTWEMRLRADEWMAVPLGRTIQHTFGVLVFIVALIAAAFLRDRRLVVMSLIGLGGYVLAFLLFWKLHQVHWYYQYANAIFLLFAASLAIYAAFRAQPVIAALALIIVAMGMQSTFSTIYEKELTPRDNGRARPVMFAADWVRQNTPENSALITMFVDWNPEFHFYAERKGIAMRRGFGYDMVERILTNPTEFTDGKPVGAWVLCDRMLQIFADEAMPPERRRIALLEAWRATKKEVARDHNCSIYQDPAA